MLTIQMKNKMIFNIRNMPMKKLCERINAYAVYTRYCNDDNVCELLDAQSNIKVVHLNPDYFGSETAYIVIDDELNNDFKKLFIRNILSGWENLSYDEKMDYINNFEN